MMHNLFTLLNKLCELSVPNFQLNSLLGGEQCEVTV